MSLQIKTYPDASSFLEDNLAFLEKEEAVNNLLLGIARGLIKIKDPNLLFLAVTDGRDPFFCGLQTPPRNLIIYGDTLRGREAAALVHDILKEKGRRIPGVLGPTSAALSFVQEWTERSGGSWSEKRSMTAYRLDEVKLASPPEGVFQPATKEDSELLAEWTVSFMMEAMNDEISLEDAGETVREKLRQGRLFVWENNGPVAMAGVDRPTGEGISVNYVYTPPNLRGKGYATACVARMSELMLQKGYRFCTLFADVKNPVANNIYCKMGYYPIADFMEINLF